MFNFGFKNLKSLRDRGSILVLFALLLPVMLLFFILAVDIGLLYSERTKLQGIADAAALAGATERYQGENAAVKLPSMSKNNDLNPKTAASGRIIAARVWEYLLLNNQLLAKPADDKSNCQDITPGFKSEELGFKSNATDSEIAKVAIGDGAFQFTNFTANDDEVFSYDTHSSGSTDIMENYASLVSNFSKDKYDGPEIADIPENIGKIAVQCGVPVDNKDRVRVRLRKLVPTVFIHLFYSGYDNGVPITVVAAAQTRKPLASFRLVGLHGIWVNFTSIPGNEGINYVHDTEKLKYIEGNVYCGDNLSVCGESGFVPHSKTRDKTDPTAGYHPNQLTIKGKIFVRNYSTGTTSRPETKHLLENTYADEKRDYELFYKIPAKDGTRHANGAEYLYMRYDPILETMRYATESTLDANPAKSASEGWYHVYNFNRYTSWERVKVWNDDLQRFMAFPPHLMRIGLAPKKDREDFLEATRSALSLRQSYRMQLNALYKEAIMALGEQRDKDDSKWRYLKATTKNNSVLGTKYCSIKSSDAGKSIKLLVEIEGVPTTDYAGSYDTKNALAFLHSNNTVPNLNIEQMVVVIKEPGVNDDSILHGNEYMIYHNGNQYNRETTLRKQTGTLMIENVRSGLTIGDVYSEANLCLAGDIGASKNIITFNGVLFSEKNIVVPYQAQPHNFTGSCSIFGNRVIMGYSYGNTKIDSANRNFNCSDLTAGLDYPVNVFVRKRHLFSTNLSSHTNEGFTPTVDSDVPMHYVLLGLTDDEYHAEVFKHESEATFNDDLDPASLELKEYEYNYNYHWFNPNMKMVYYPLSNDRLEHVVQDSSNTNFKDKYVYKFEEGHYGFQKITNKTTQSIIPKDYFDIYSSTNYPANNLFSYLKGVNVQKSSDKTNGLVDENDMLELRKNWHVAPNANNNNTLNYDKHVIAYMKEENQGTLYHYYIKSEYPYFGGHYKTDGLIERQLFEIPSDFNGMLQVYGTALNKDTSISTSRVFENIFYTPYDKDFNKESDAKPLIRVESYSGNNNSNLNVSKTILAKESYEKNGDKFHPWYCWLPTFRGTGKKDIDYDVSLLDANRVYLNFWKRAANYSNYPGLINPFAYCQDKTSREKIMKMVHGIDNGDVTAIEGGPNAATRAQREGYIYRFTLDLDMMIAYRIDDLMRYGNSKTLSVSDSGGKRLFDEATNYADIYGEYPGRNGADGQKYIVHAFGVPDDSIYSSIGLVE